MVGAAIRDTSKHPAVQAALAARTISPLTAEEVVVSGLFPAGIRSSYMTGHVMAVDGGLRIT
ncbi:MAG: hypothetical protein EXR28_09915 [Betaproteobacteria bacterium]|nr:hypothetical protein [Betaproteobacteria bacterium]